MNSLSQLQGSWCDQDKNQKIYVVKDSWCLVRNADSTNWIMKGTNDAYHPLFVVNGEVFWGHGKSFVLQMSADGEVAEWISRNKKKRGFSWNRVHETSDWNEWDADNWGESWDDNGIASDWRKNGTRSSNWKDDQETNSWATSKPKAKKSSKSTEKPKKQNSPQKARQEPIENTVSEEPSAIPTNLAENSLAIPPIHAQGKRESQWEPQPPLEAPLELGVCSSMEKGPPRGSMGSTWFSLRELVVRETESLDSKNIATLPKGIKCTQAAPWTRLQLEGATLYRMQILHHFEDLGRTIDGYVTVHANDGKQDHFYLGLSLTIQHVGQSASPTPWPLATNDCQFSFVFPEGCLGAEWLLFDDVALYASTDDYQVVAELQRNTQMRQCDTWTVDNAGTLSMLVLAHCAEDVYSEGCIVFDVRSLGKIMKGGTPSLVLISEPILQ